MKLSQRLTRAGLTLILLGSVAAVLPAQLDEAALADGTCTKNGATFKVVKNSTQTAPGGDTPAIGNNDLLASDQSYTYYYRYFSPSGNAGTFTSVTSNASNSLSVTTGVINFNRTNNTAPSSNSTMSDGFAVRLASTSSTTNNMGNFTVTYTPAGATYTVRFTVSGARS